MNHTDTLNGLAIAFRKALEEHLAANRHISINTNIDDPTSKFPKNCCLGSSGIFGQFLLEVIGIENVEFVTGLYRDSVTHTWTEVHDHIIDMTADQFGEEIPKVIVLPIDQSLFHKALEHQRRLPSRIPTTGTFREVLNAVTEQLKSQLDFNELRVVLNPPVDLKEKLFKKYSKNLDLISPVFFPKSVEELKGKYICPLCLEAFGIESLDSSVENHLTEEHIPPQSVGWKRKVLTCKSCNNTHGGQFDSQVLLILKTMAFNQNIPGAMVQGKFNVGDKTANGVVIINEDGTTRKSAIIKERTNPKDYEEIKNRLQQNIPDDITITWKTGDMKRALISMIRAAYLWGFADYGYAFIVNQNFKLLRDQIMQPDKDIFFERQVLIGEFDEAWEGINVVIEPKDLLSYAFMMNLNAYGVTNRICVLLPGADHEGLNRLNQLRTQITTDKPDISFFDASHLSALHSPDNCFDIFRIWFDQDEEHEEEDGDEEEQEAPKK